ncbi:hypothetical protein D3C80_1920140 [compost metagenome]
MLYIYWPHLGLIVLLFDYADAVVSNTGETFGMTDMLACDGSVFARRGGLLKTRMSSMSKGKLEEANCIYHELMAPDRNRRDR